MSNNKLAIFLIITSVFFGTVMLSFLKVAQEDVNVYTAGFLRFFFGLLIILPYIIKTNFSVFKTIHFKKEQAFVCQMGWRLNFETADLRTRLVGRRRLSQPIMWSPLWTLWTLNILTIIEKFSARNLANWALKCLIFSNPNRDRLDKCNMVN